MKVLKKFASIIIAVCLMIPVLSTVVFAADGVLMFSDPSTKVGENVSVDFVVQSSGGTIGSVDVTMSYDPKALEFVSGDGFTADGAGTLTYKGTGGGNRAENGGSFQSSYGCEYADFCKQQLSYDFFRRYIKFEQWIFRNFDCSGRRWNNKCRTDIGS